MILYEERARLPSRLKRGQLMGSLRDISEDDLTTAGVYLVAKKVKPAMPFELDAKNC